MANSPISFHLRTVKVPPQALTAPSFRKQLDIYGEAVTTAELSPQFARSVVDACQETPGGPPTPLCPYQRPISASRVDQYTDEINGGAWHLSTDCIRLIIDGPTSAVRASDQGQHRLHAAARASLSSVHRIVWKVVDDIGAALATPPADFLKFDRGARRSFSHLISSATDFPSSSAVASMTKVATTMEGLRDPYTTGRPGDTDAPTDGSIILPGDSHKWVTDFETMLNWLNSQDHGAVMDAVNYSTRERFTGQLSPQALSTVYFLAHKHIGQDAAGFFDDLVNARWDGVAADGTKAGTLLLHDASSNWAKTKSGRGRPSPVAQVDLILTALHYWLESKRAKLLAHDLKKSGHIPVVPESTWWRTDKAA